jgi:hypothetical protein
MEGMASKSRRGKLQLCRFFLLVYRFGPPQSGACCILQTLWDDLQLRLDVFTGRHSLPIATARRRQGEKTFQLPCDVSIQRNCVVLSAGTSTF